MSSIQPRPAGAYPYFNWAWCSYHWSSWSWKHLNCYWWTSERLNWLFLPTATQQAHLKTKSNHLFFLLFFLQLFFPNLCIPRPYFFHIFYTIIQQFGGIDKNVSIFNLFFSFWFHSNNVPLFILPTILQACQKKKKKTKCPKPILPPLWSKRVVLDLSGKVLYTARTSKVTLESKLKCPAHQLAPFEQGFSLQFASQCLVLCQDQCFHICAAVCEAISVSLMM
jgi:hypothetical protein